MENIIKKIILLIEQQFHQLNEEDGKNLNSIIQSFVESYAKHKDFMSLDEWLSLEIEKNIEEISKEEAKEISDEIILSLKNSEENKKSLKKAVKQGRSKESWFASKIKNHTSNMSTQQTVQYLQELDDQITIANDFLNKTITTKAGTINQNSNLDGFIAEQYHAQTFNLNAEACGSPFRAEVLEPNGHGYAKNSVDIVIKNGDGKIVSKYQSKYYKDAESAIKAFNQGDYRGQKRLVADGQEELVKNASNVIESPDGVKSNSLSKDDAIKMRDEAQKEGKIRDLNWNEYKTKDIAMNLGKQTGYAALQGAVIGVGLDVAQKLKNQEEIKPNEVVEVALKSGADFGLKAAVAGALKVAVEKGVVKAIPKGTPVAIISNIAYIGIENAKIAIKVASGDMTMKEGLEEVEMTTVSVVAGLAGTAAGTVCVTKAGLVVGAKIGIVLGPAGILVGGFIGGTIGYMAGVKVGEKVVKGFRMIRNFAVKKVKSIASELNSKIKNSTFIKNLSLLFN